MYVKKSCFQVFLVFHPWSLSLKTLGRGTYHPISLVSTISKISENLLNNRLVDHLKKLSFSSNFQYIFRYSRATADL